MSLELGSAGARLSLTMTQTDADAEPLAKYFASGHADGVLLISEHGRHGSLASSPPPAPRSSSVVVRWTPRCG